MRGEVPQSAIKFSTEWSQVGKVFALQGTGAQLGILCWPILSMVYRATLVDAPYTVYLMVAEVMLLVLVLTLSVYHRLSR